MPSLVATLDVYGGLLAASGAGVARTTLTHLSKGNGHELLRGVPDLVHARPALDLVELVLVLDARVLRRDRSITLLCWCHQRIVRRGAVRKAPHRMRAIDVSLGLQFLA